jgi:colanic acid/amylovoran biosynthesis glycosyltransferase
MQTVLVFTGSLLPPSETFIAQHARSLRRFNSLLVGLKKVAGIVTDASHTRILSLNVLEKVAFYFFGICRKLDQIVEENNVVILHAHFLDNGLLLARYAARKQLPLLVTLHGADVLRNSSGISLRRRVFRRLLLQFALRSVALFLPVSDYMKAECEGRGFPAARMVRHYLGIPITNASSTSQTSKDPNILFVGRLVEKKGVFFLLDAIATLVKQDKRVTATFIGAGPLAERLQQLSQQQDLPIRFLGAQPHDTVLREMKSAAIFCMPSTRAPDGDNEGLGLVYLEAQMLGVPVVAFKQGPVPEAVADGRTGLLAEDGDTGSLARCLAALLDDADRAREMGRQGQDFVRSRFDIVRQAERLEDIYQTVLDEREQGIDEVNSVSLYDRMRRAS